MKKAVCFILALSMAVSFAGCKTNKPGTSSSAAQNVELTVAAAASLTDVSKELATAYQSVAPNVTVNFTYGASGTLQTQIEQGAPVDIFLSAATKQMDALDKEGLLQDGTKTNLLENKVVLIVPKSSTLGLTSFNDLASDKVKKVAIGDPASVPAGQYAQTVLTNLKIWDTVNAKSTLGTDVRTVLTDVETGNVDAGIVYSTDAMTSTNVNVICEAPAGSVDKIIYPAAVLKSSQHVTESQNFIDFLKSDTAVTIFKKYGFSMAS